MASEFAVDEGDVPIGVASVHWRRTGSGPALVFVPGFPLSGCTWDKVIAPLRERFTCYTFDLIGLGRSYSRSDVDHSSPGQARALMTTLRELNVGTYILVGNDTGGWVAREMALIDAANVRGLALTNTEIPFHRPPWIPTYQVLAELPGAGLLLQQLIKLRAFRRSPLGFGGCFYDLDFIDGDFHQRFVEPLLASRERIEGTMRFLRNMKFRRIDEFKQLHQELRMPTVFIWGADDPTFPEEHGRAMLPQFPNVVGFHSIARAKLFLYEEHPREVAALVEELARSTQSSSR